VWGDGVAISAMTATLEVEMTKLFKTRTSRLICLGGAKARTNAVETNNVAEDNLILGFNE
jgi:hypothetical protein